LCDGGNKWWFLYYAWVDFRLFDYITDKIHLTLIYTIIKYNIKRKNWDFKWVNSC